MYNKFIHVYTMLLCMPEFNYDLIGLASSRCQGGGNGWNHAGTEPTSACNSVENGEIASL